MEVILSALITVGGMLAVAAYTSYSQREVTLRLLNSKNKERRDEIRRRELIRCSAELVEEIQPREMKLLNVTRVNSLIAQLTMYLNENNKKEAEVMRALGVLHNVLRAENKTGVPGGVGANPGKVTDAITLFVSCVKKVVQ